MILSQNNRIINFNDKVINFLSPITPVVPSIITDNLYLKLDASNYISGVWLDETGNNNNGTINGANWLPNDGGVFNFDGVNDTISIPHNINLSLSTIIQKTLQIWVKFDRAGTGANRRILFSKLSSGFGFDGYFGGIDSSRKTVVATNGTGIARTTESALTVNLSQWYLFTFISQITGTANSTKVYINEIEFSSSQHGVDGYSEANPLTLGYMPAPLGGLGLIEYLDGQIGAVYFYTKGLTLNEITTNYNATKTKYGF
jgi:hypothetical protein